jgi:bla regulator protein blaR1
MKMKTLIRIAFVKQIALVLVFSFTGSFFPAKVVGQEINTPPPQTNTMKKRLNSPEDFPSFNHERYSAGMGFSSWVASQIKYPPKTLKDKIQGWVHVCYTVEPDGTLNNVKINAASNPELGKAVTKVMKSSSPWMPAKNKEKAEPINSSVNIKFEIPERILSSQDIPIYVIDEVPTYLPEELHRFLNNGQMPQMSQAKDATLKANQAAIREWLSQYLKYPDEAVKEKVEGIVVVRFIITKSGKLDDFIIIKSIHPLLDAEALRVLNLMPDWKPAMQEGEPKDVYYYAWVEYKLPK